MVTPADHYQATTVIVEYEAARTAVNSKKLYYNASVLRIQAMYTKRVQIVNYGPIDHLDIAFPFEGDTPKPVVLVGENGSGKSILLSHIVNGLISAKDTIYPDTTEVEVNKVYKIRSGSYIKSGSEFYFARVDFESNLFMGEIRSKHPKQEYSGGLEGLSGSDAEAAWQEMKSVANDHQVSNIFQSKDEIEDIFSKNCALYFPPNRFEEPAWLNEENLKNQAEYMDRTRLKGHTNRKLINYSQLHDNQNWLFEVIYDSAVFETQTANLPIHTKDSDQPHSLPILLGPSGNATRTYEIALQVVRSVMKENQNVRFGIGRRLNRVVSIQGEMGTIVPNIFQLSSGETSLISLFLSILRDFDLCGASFTKAKEIRGIVVVDEIDLHLHATHQHTILPGLMRIFPNVQFVVTTHSPLFILGMKKIFGEDGFALHCLPSGQQISPEEFSEFESAYQTFTATGKFSEDIQKEIEAAQKPVVFVDGTTDVKYLERASELLGQEALLGEVHLRDAGGGGNLGNIWKKTTPILADVLPQKVVLLHDCDDEAASQDKGNLIRRTIPMQSDHPIRKGIENLFGKAVLQRALEQKPAFIDIDRERTKMERGKEIAVPERWSINKDEKTNLCHWLCENGAEDDFQHFEVIFQLLQDILNVAPRVPANHLSEDGKE